MDKPVVVIGGGIVGTAVAHELQLKGAPTMLVERDVEPQGASAFSFASLTSFDEPQRDVYLLKNHGMIAWRRWAKVYGDELGVRFDGELRWAESTDGGRFLTELFQRAHGRGYPVKLVKGEEVKKLEPASNFSGTFTATYAAGDGQADPVLAIHTLTSAFTEHGGMLLIGRAALHVEQRGITVRVGEDRIEASSVILATGAETTSLLERLGWDAPMDPSPGLLCVTRPLERFLNRTVYVYPKGEVPVHLRQLDDGRVLIGERAQDAVVRNPSTEHARMLLRQASKAFPILKDSDLEHFTVEWRPMPRDRMPIVGPLPGLPSLYVATGHSGVTIAPALAEFITKEILEGTEQDRLKAFRPSRFSAHTADAYRSVEEAFGEASELFIG
ncbi:MAG TPA: FAD-dependent oxidoreductase [Actinomycetota bacterium]|nr:FAD-dependent oxidoreductase [Actinomycetota bacterium]